MLTLSSPQRRALAPLVILILSLYTLLELSSKNYVNTGFSSAESPHTFGALLHFSFGIFVVLACLIFGYFELIIGHYGKNNFI